MQPDAAYTQPVKTKQFPKQRHYLAVFFISFTWGLFGVDRMYLGKWGTGLLKLVTIGGFGVWALADINSIMRGTMRDKQGREMLQVAEYKPLARKTAYVFGLVTLLFVILIGVILFLVLTQLMSSIESGSVPSIPGFNGLIESLQGFTGGLSPEQRAEFDL